jgi:Leucine-rich repeat (LRR) protein
MIIFKRKYIFFIVLALFLVVIFVYIRFQLSENPDEKPGKIFPSATPTKLVDNINIGFPTSVKKVVNCDGVVYKDIKSALKNKNSACILDLSSSNLTVIDENIFLLNNLKSLFLQRNLLETVPEEIGKLELLEVLNLNDNKISSLPIEMCALKHLKKLDLSNNKFENVSADIGCINSLEELDMYENKIDALSPVLSFFHKLLVLNLSYNRISRIPKDFSGLSQLKYLFFVGNNLSSEDMQNLKALFPKANIYIN